MNRIAMFTAAVLVASTFVLGAPAAADDVEECLEEGEVELCLYDSTEGDQEEACSEEGSGDYNGFTGVTADVGSGAPSADAEAGGEDDCYHSSFTDYYDRDQRIYIDADVCLQQGFFFCSASAGGDAEWNQEAIDIDVSSSSPAGYYSVSVDWGEDFNGDCEIGASVFYLGPPGFGYEGVSEDCQDAYPPAAPNPGWGQVTPDTGE